MGDNCIKMITAIIVPHPPYQQGRLQWVENLKIKVDYHLDYLEKTKNPVECFSGYRYLAAYPTCEKICFAFNICTHFSTCCIKKHINRLDPT